MPENNNNKPKSLLQRIVQAVNDFFLLLARFFGFVGKEHGSARQSAKVKPTDKVSVSSMAISLASESQLSLGEQRLLDLQPLIEKIKLVVVTQAGRDETSNPKFLARKVKAKSTHGNLSFNGTDAAARSLVKTKEFIDLLMDKNGETAKRLIESDASIGVNTASEIPITLKSLLQYSFDGLDVDYLVYGTDNKDSRVRSVEQRKQDLATAKANYPKLSQAFLTLARAMGEEGKDDLVKQCQVAPTSRYQGSLKALFDTLQGAIDDNQEKKEELCSVPGYTYDSMIGQPLVLMSDFEEGDSTKNYHYDKFVDKIIDDYMLFDQWLGHMVFDKMHITCAMAGQKMIPFQGENGPENKTVAEVIGAVCERLDKRLETDPHDQAADDASKSMRVRLEQVFNHVAKTDSSLQYPSSAPQGSSSASLGL